MHVRARVHAHLCMCVHVRVHTCMHARVCMHVFACVCMHMHVCVGERVGVRTCVSGMCMQCVHVCAHMCTCACVHMCVCVHVRVCKGEGVRVPSMGRDRPRTSLSLGRQALPEWRPHNQGPEGARLALGAALICGGLQVVSCAVQGRG